METLTGRRIVITGASSGIGAAAARMVVERDGRVGLIARQPEPLAALADELGSSAVVAAADVTDPAATEAAMADLDRQLGGFDALVNSAGIYRSGLVADFDLGELRSMMEINVVGLVTATQKALPYLRAEVHADLINVSSMSGRRVPSASGALYSASKFAVHALSQGLRMELQESSIRTTVIAPGFVSTAIGDALDGDDGEAFRRTLREQGMAPESAAATIIAALTAPPDSELIELAVMPRQP